jgi:uncharacterized membrane protein YphA (DoxX/SURF4 family)
MKKTVLTIIRWIVGLLFIFSGLVKANDPLGLSYKMQEFFEVWGWHFLDNYTLAFSIVMNAFEVLAGVAVIVGWRMKLFNWLLLLLIIFFTFLTGFALFSGKIKNCGCFGDCLPLTAAQSFTKDLILLLLIIVLFANTASLKRNVKPFASLLFLTVSVVFIITIQFISLRHLPFVDCLPYKVGNNILEQMKKPANAVPDSFAITYQYEKGGKLIEFDSNHFPDDFDSTYQFVKRFDKLARKGTGEAKIVDFSLTSMNDKDTTQAIFSQKNHYVLIFVKDFSAAKEWKNDKFNTVLDALRVRGTNFLYVTADADNATKYIINKSRILKCDATVIKTAARAVPTFFVMEGATILGKYSYEDADNVYEHIDNVKRQ